MAPTPSNFDPAAEANALASQFYAASNAVDQLRLNLNPPLPERQRLRDESLALETRAQYFTAQAIGATLAAIQSSLAQIRATTGQAVAQFVHLQDVDRAITLATSLLSLGTAIAAGDPGTILSAARGLADTLNTTGKAG